MKLVSEEVRTLSSTMTIVDCKERAARPKVDLLELGFYDIQDYRDTILVVIPHHTLMSVCCVCHHYPILFRSKLCRIIVLSELYNLLLLHLHIFFSLAHCHLHTSIFYYVIGPQILFEFLFLGFFSSFLRC